jgi:hypothetical protein
VGRGKYCVSWNVQICLCKCTLEHYHTSVDLWQNLWISALLVDELTMGSAELATDHWTSASLTCMCRDTWKILFMNARWAHQRTWFITLPVQPHTETFFIVWIVLFWNWQECISKLKADILDICCSRSPGYVSHVQPLSKTSCYSKCVCHVHIIVTSPTNSSCNH